MKEWKLKLFALVVFGIITIVSLGVATGHDGDVLRLGIDALLISLAYILGRQSK